MNRRNFIQGSAVGAASVLVIGAGKCGGKSVAATVQIITGAIADLKPLFPSQSANFNKIVALATDFNSDWIAGKFDSARTAFENLDTLINQVITDLQVNASTKVTLLLATLGIALRTIAAIIAESGQSNLVAAKSAQGIAPQTVNRVNQLADPAVAAGLLKAVRR